MSVRTNSAQRRLAKTAKVETTGMKPTEARPEAMPIMFISATPRLMKRSGNSF